MGKEYRIHITPTEDGSAGNLDPQARYNYTDEKTIGSTNDARIRAGLREMLKHLPLAKELTLEIKL